MSAVWLYLRLVVAVALLLAPGWLIARALGVRGLAATLAWGFLAIFVGLGVTFAVGGSLGLALVLLGAIALVSLRPALRRPWPAPSHGVGAVLVAGALLGLFLWRVAGEIGGDGVFHMARARKLLELGDLSLQRVGEFTDGSLHPGYAFPLWHGFLALVAKVSGADPAEVVLHLPSVLMPLALLVGFEAARALFRRSGPAAAAAATGFAMYGMAPGAGGAFTSLALPATASRQLFVPAVLALALTALRSPSPAVLASAGAASFALAVIHPTYAIFVWIPFLGFLGVRFLWDRRDLRRGATALAALVLPAAVYFVALLPVISTTASVSPDAGERDRGLDQYAGQLDVRSPDSFSLVPDIFGRTGAVAVAALLLLPLAGFAARRRWAAFAVGGALAVFAVTLLPFVFAPFSDVVSLSQSRRLAGFLPFGIALAGGIGVAAARLGRATAPLALAAGIALQLAYPGDFGYRLDDGGPALVTWIAVVGALAALGYGLLGRAPVEARAGLAAALLLAPTYVHGLSSWSPNAARQPTPLSVGLRAAIAERVPKGATVYADPETSYQVGGYAPVYVCVNPPAHVADTEKNRPRERVAEYRRFARTGDLAIPRACGATWLVVDRQRSDLRPALPVAYEDARWALYRIVETGAS
jgi:hypothetical protein